MSKKTKLELTWIGKEHRPRLEPRILLEEADKSHHAAHRVTDRDPFDNRLIHGDNLLALKALEQDFAGQVKYLEKIIVSPADNNYDFIYLNGPHTLNDPHNKVHLIEETFHRLMFDTMNFESLS